MKALDVIEIFDKIRPNSFDYKSKMAWVKSVETDIRRFAALHMENAMDTTWQNEENPELFLDSSFSDLYVYYLVSMADMTNGEYRLYNISSTYFNSLFDKWKRQYRSSKLPEKSSAIKM